MIPMVQEVECQLSQVDRIIVHEIFRLEASQNFYFFLLNHVSASCNEGMCIGTLCKQGRGSNGSYYQSTRCDILLWHSVIGGKVFHPV